MATEARCPKCGGRLHAHVVEEYSGVYLTVRDGCFNYDTMEGDIDGSYITSAGCESCSFETDKPHELLCEEAD